MLCWQKRVSYAWPDFLQFDGVHVIDYCLRHGPPETKDTLEHYQYLIFDGTFLHRPVSLVTLMDGRSNTVISGQYGISENSDSQLLSFFKPLIAKDLQPTSCTVDGNPQAMRVLKSLWPEIITQRCLVHIQRQGLMWCRSYPKTVPARRLREIFLQVTNIRTYTERDRFLGKVNQWEEKYGWQMVTQPERGRVFSDLKRARSMLQKALPDMFHYLDDSNISFSTNGLEGYFSRLKSRYRGHRGLCKTKLHNYFHWYLFLRPK